MHERCCGNCCCCVVEFKLDAILELLIAIYSGRAVDLNIVFGLTGRSPMKGSATMNKKASGPVVKCACLAKKGGPKKAVMPDVTFTDPLPKSMILQPLDAAGAVIVLTSADTVSTTLVSDSAVFVVSAGVDNLNYVATIPPQTPFGSVANLAATAVGTIQGAPADLIASVKVTLNVPPSPVAVDLAIIFA